MTVDDRVAFACMFLSDNKLHEYLKSLTNELIEEGNLDGFLLTGLLFLINFLYTCLFELFEKVIVEMVFDFYKDT